MRTVKTCFLLTLLSLIGVTSAREVDDSSFVPAGFKKIVVLQPTGEIINDLPVMLILSDTTQLYNSVDEIANNSFIDEALDMYYLAATYLKNNNELETIEPAYLALSNNDGGYAKVGFHLKHESEYIEKSRVPYIDIVEGRVGGKHDRLMSITQLYPHEMGHLIYRMLYTGIRMKNSKSVDMHYFSVRTDYSTAFNEGFAEHIENISRIFEKNEALKDGIFKDIEKTKIRSRAAIRGFEKDFLNPFRFGYYKMSMPIWYQKYENLKRYEHAIDGSVRYLNSTLELSDIEDQLTFRNAGIRQNTDELRNYVQMLCTEGVISAFFTRLTRSELANHYLDASFYKPFLVDTAARINSPDEIFSPIQNQFLKYFVIFHTNMSKDSTKSEFIDFVEGYFQAYPSEEETLKKIFKEVTKLEYTNILPPELWLLVKNHTHRFLVIDPYGAITLPVYTFDLNASEMEDLLTIKGIQKEEAIRIVEYRKENGFFTSLDQIKDIEGISDESVSQVLNCKYDQDYVDGIPQLELSIKSLITVPLKHLIFRALAYFILIIFVIYLFLLINEKQSIKKLFTITLIYLFLWFLFVLAGLIFVVVSDQSWQFLILLVILIILVTAFIHRKEKKKRMRSFFATALMGLLILFSII